ncbi:MAG: SMP-30/gluconolactonase/LRE family protein [Planctomycetales bacterium]|nr:SMP-30/gluconolactonase/LRE family protein [Planctomycetales bacterium]
MTIEQVAVRFAAVVAILGGFSACDAAAQSERISYPLTEASKFHEGTPRGRIEGPFEHRSEVFPGTVRQYWIYVPEQYKADKPACLLVLQDGLGLAKNWHVPEVLDNLIHEGEMPVTLGLFIDHGRVEPAREGGRPRFNRSFEYDSMTDRYAAMLVDEVLPEVAKRYRFSDDPNDRMIAGASSGAICALAAAWSRPDEFRRVYSAIGTYVGLRGGDEFSTLVRKCEPKPLRVFLQDGSRDLDLYAGGWWPANQQMFAALEWAGYDVGHAWGEGGHDAEHAAAVLPEAMRWLWRDYPQPIERGLGPARRIEVVTPGSDWELVSEGHGFCEGPAISPGGELFFSDLRTDRIYRVKNDGKVEIFAEETGAANGLMFGGDGTLYACADKLKRIVAYDAQGNVRTLCENVRSNDLVVVEKGVYFTDPSESVVRFVDWDGRQRVVAKDLAFPNGIAVSPDRAFLYVAEMRGRTVSAFRIEQDDELSSREPLYALHLSPEKSATDADGMTVDENGNLYVTTDAGLQICDPLGRVNLILAKPDRDWLSNVVFGGSDMSTLYVTCGGKVYRRQVKTKGFEPWSTPVTPPRPGL